MTFKSSSDWYCGGCDRKVDGSETDLSGDHLQDRGGCGWRMYPWPKREDVPTFKTRSGVFRHDALKALEFLLEFSHDVFEAPAGLALRPDAIPKMEAARATYRKALADQDEELLFTIRFFNRGRSALLDGPKLIWPTVLSPFAAMLDDHLSTEEARWSSRI